MQPEPVMSPARPPPSVDPLERIAESIKGMPLSPDLKKAAVFQGSPSPALRGINTTPKARLRYNDSQIQFAAIDSSPLQPELAESQYLTDRQKEVKERQGREAAAMFPEIRSSPRSTSQPTEYNLPKLLLKSTQNPVPTSVIDKDTSPTHLPDALMNVFLGSSPTPISKRSSERCSDDGPPSSPPFFSPPQNKQLPDAPLAHDDHAPIQVIVNAEDLPGDRFTGESLPSTKRYSCNGEPINAVVDAPEPVSEQEDASRLKAPQIPVDAHPMSDFDIYVDAPSLPSLNETFTEHNDNQANDVASSFRSDTSSHFSAEDDQVTAQLITEMERASSQQSAKHEETAKSAQGATKKRKRTADSSDVTKKTKRMPVSSGETVADCVMIDVREADRLRAVPPQQIKRELSASPSIPTSIQAVEETPIARNPLANRLRSLVASQSSSQERDTLITAKKASALRKKTRVSERLSGSTSGSPHKSPATSQDATKGDQWFPMGKTPSMGMFRWLQRSSAESEDRGSRPDPARTASSANEGNAEGMHDVSLVDHDAQHHTTTQNEGGESVASGGDGEAQAEAGGVVESEGDRPTAAGILQHFQSMLDKIKRVTFGPEEERAMVGILFECVKEVHEAGRRHISM